MQQRLRGGHTAAMCRCCTAMYSRQLVAAAEPWAADGSGLPAGPAHSPALGRPHGSCVGAEPQLADAAVAAASLHLQMMWVQAPTLSSRQGCAPVRKRLQCGSTQPCTARGQYKVLRGADAGTQQHSKQGYSICIAQPRQYRASCEAVRIHLSGSTMCTDRVVLLYDTAHSS